MFMFILVKATVETLTINRTLDWLTLSERRVKVETLVGDADPRVVSVITKRGRGHGPRSQPL